MKRIFYILLPLLVVSACVKTPRVEDDSAASIINIGGVGIDMLSAMAENGLPFSKADASLGYVPAEDSTWLLRPLFTGLEVRYRKVSGQSEAKIARLRLKKASDNAGETKENIKRAGNGLAEYTLNLLDENFDRETTPAKWQGNGEHLFQGVYVPNEIRKSTVQGQEQNPASNLTTDQSGVNYTSLIHYLAMPANTKINATTGRIVLPYGHRLARVLAYVLIDPAMGPDVKLQGFNLVDGKDDPHTTQIRFGNVGVLDYVEKQREGSNERLIPHWTTSKKVIPHFTGMRESRDSKGRIVNEGHFLVFHDKKNEEDIFPTADEKWTKAKADWDAKYNAASGTEAEKIKSANENSDYERRDYGMVPCYDLVVRPTYTAPEKILYDEAAGVKSGTRNKIDFELTLNTGLSYAKTFEFTLDANYQTIVFLKINQVAVDYNEAGSDKWIVEDNKDGYYGVNNRNGNALSKAGSSWQRAYRIGEPRADRVVTDGHFYDNTDATDPDDIEAQYVTEESWLELFKQACIDGEHHGDYFILEQDITIDLSKTETEDFPNPFVFTGHLDCQGHKITLTNAGSKIFTPGKAEGWLVTTDYTLDGIRQKSGEEYVPFVLPDLYVLEDREYQQVVGMTLQYFMTSTETYYRKNGDTYEVFQRPEALYVWYPGEYHFTPSYLFSGLNGAYAAEVGTANVYSQGGVLVPYVDADSKTGWRAEILNAVIVGGDLFPAEAYDGENHRYNVDFVSGYVYNCKKGSQRIPDHVPARPKYK